MAQPNPDELSSRDLAILRDLDRVRLLTGRQLERLHFGTLVSANARSSARRRSLGRLARAGLVTTLPRRVGGERAGSAGLVYTLDGKGRRLLDAGAARDRIRRPWAIGWPFVQHTLDVAELYVRLVEREAAGNLKLLRFAAEPASWFPAGPGLLKPDAWVVYETPEWERHHWLEVDRATESLPTISRKLHAYVDVANAGRRGPLGVTPSVIVTVPNDHRLAAVRQLITALPDPAAALITVQLFNDVFSTATRPPP